MEKWHVLVLLLGGAGLLVLSVLIRARFGEKYEIRTADLVLIVVPLVIALLVSGKMKVLDAFGIRADFSELFADAAGSDIQSQIAPTASPAVDELVDMLQMASKAGVREIPRLIQNRTEALVFKLGHGGYYGPAIEQYFDALYASSFFQYFIILDEKNRLFGICDALDLAVFFRTEGSQAYADLARWLNRPDPESLERLAGLPGFIGRGQAVERDWSKQRVLARMDSLKVESIPVVNAEDGFAGMVKRSEITASLILDITKRLEAGGGGS